MIRIFKGWKFFFNLKHDLVETLLQFVSAFSVSVIQEQEQLTFWAPEKAW